MMIGFVSYCFYTVITTPYDISQKTSHTVYVLMFDVFQNDISNFTMLKMGLVYHIVYPRDTNI